MKIINLKIDVLKPYDKNPRKNKEAVKYVAESIKEFGFKQPIVIDKICYCLWTYKIACCKTIRFKRSALYFGR